MVKEDLIYLWMANGFFQSKGSMEDAGNEIFNELLCRSLFQDARKDEDDDIVSCKMHDLVHDVACSITMNECTTVEVNKDNNVFKLPTRHLVLEFGIQHLSTDILNLWLSKSQPLLRTLKFQRSVEILDNHYTHGLTFTNLKCLRVLDLSHNDITTLHVSIGNLKHLRYLDLSNCHHLLSFPDESICNLRNLQVLKLDNCGSLQVLPEKMSKMTNLRHLGIKGCYDLERMAVGMGNLSCLRTLSKFVVGPKTGHGITELQGLDHLTGELEIQGLEHVRNSKDARNANLMRKKHLRVLSLFWSEKYNGTIEEEVVASIGEGLQPHPNIRVLDLNCYNGLKFPSWMSHSCLPNLVKISLVGCRRCEHLPALGRLAFLEYLKIGGMDSKDRLIVPIITTIRNLQNAKLRTLPTTLLSALTELKLGGECNEMMLESSSPLVKVIGCLQKLEIRSFNKIKVKTLPKVFMENLPSTLTELHIWGCEELVCLPEGVMQNLTSLSSFKIWDCPSLKYIPELGSKNNTALRSLRIHYCSGLTSVSDCLRHLTALELLMIDSKSPELEFLPDDFQDLTFLRDLSFFSLPQMTCSGLQHVAGTLERLCIFDCSGMTSLPEWMDKFTSLRDLDIHYCKNLKVLPEELLHLTSLEEVTIANCHPDLHRRCAKETGEDWHKIAHVPNLCITEDGIGGSMKCNMIPCFSSS